MATLIFTALGTAIGGPVGGLFGFAAGQQIDSLVFAPAARQGPRLAELAVTTSSYGAAIPRQFGRVRAAGQIIWATDLVEHRDKHGNGKGKPATVTFSYTVSFAVALSSRPLAGIGRIWADGKLLRGADGQLKTGGSFRFHAGLGDQAADPLIAAAEGTARAPAWRGTAYCVFEDLQVADYGNRIPALSFELFGPETTIAVATLLDGVIAESDAPGVLTGITGLSNDGPLGDLLGALGPLYPVNADGAGERLVIAAEGADDAEPLALSDPVPVGGGTEFGGKQGFALNRAAEALPPVAAVRYYDEARDYLPGVQRAPGRARPGEPRTIELPATLAAGAARNLIEDAANRARWARQTAKWRVSELDPRIRPGALVRLPGHAGAWRVRDWEWRAHGVELMLVRVPAAPGIGGIEADAGRASMAEDAPPAPTELVACELPWDGNPATSVPLLLAAVSSPSSAWAGASLFADRGDGALVPLGVSGRARATIGVAADTLGAASPLLFDRQSSVTVRLAGEDLQLTNATMGQLAMGANRALLGAEIIQFASAEPTAAGEWRLTGLWRGRGGTEAGLSGHRPGEAFVLLDGSGIALAPDLVGAVPGTLIAAQGLADQAPALSAIALRGIGARPLSPVHGAARTAAGGLEVTWTRRARGAWLWEDGADTPLNEQTELYQIAFAIAGAPPLAQWTSTEPRLVVATDSLASLLAAAPSGRLAVRQIGDRGQSDPLIIALA